MLGGLLKRLVQSLSFDSITTQHCRNGHLIGPGRFECMRNTQRNKYQRRDGRIPASIPGGARRRLKREAEAALLAA